MIGRIRQRWSAKRPIPGLVAVMTVLMVLAACGGSEKNGKINWVDGVPPDNSAQTQPTSEPTADSEQPTEDTQQPTEEAQTDTGSENTPEPTKQTETAVTGEKLTEAQLEEFQPNEVGMIPVIEYHVITTDESVLGQSFTRSPDDLRKDLQWLYDNDFYVIPAGDYVTDNISAPAGKHPVVLTFDDSTAGQFRYLFDGDTPTIDPESGVGVMDAFFAEHPDFGKGALFSILPNEDFCFNWQLEEDEPDQDGYCQQKLQYLVDNGYQIGNHTRDHQDLLDVDNDFFREQLAGAFDEIEAMVPGTVPNILAMPFGNYPNGDNKEQQMEWLYDGFEWDGKSYQIIGALMVGAEAGYSPVSTEYDPMWIPRIQAEDKGDEYGYTSYWFPIFEDDPGRLYTSDGNPDTITVPKVLPDSLQGTFDESKVGDKEIVRY